MVGDMMEELQQRLREVQRRIELAAQKSGRSSQNITLLAVSKTVDNTTSAQAYDLGIRDFGENRVQELVKRGRYLEVPVPVLLQVNISGEKSKTGLQADEVESFVQSVGELTSLR